MDKAPDAFRTISEVADVLDTPAHVLRFWESRFPQIKPVKRAGGRRYYRPADVALLSGIRQLLHGEGMTIRGVQKVLREQGVRHVAALGGDFAVGAEPEATAPEILAEVVPPTAEVHQLPGRPVMPDSAEEPLAGPSATIEPLFPKKAAPVASADTAPLLFDTSPAGRPDSTIPREGEGGFIAFTQPRRSPGRGRPAGGEDPLQPTLPFEPAAAAAPTEEAPEAPHLWVDMDDDLPPLAELHGFALPASIPLPEPALPAGEEPHAEHPYSAVEPESGHPEPDSADTQAESPASPLTAPEAVVPPLAGMAARLRGLRPVSVATRADLAELHSRLGLLHAQMAEAVRLRR